jgi:hypothetical protein
VNYCVTFKLITCNFNQVIDKITMLKFLKIICVCFLRVINNLKNQLKNIDEYQNMLEVRGKKLTKCMLHFHEFMKKKLTLIHY